MLRGSGISGFETYCEKALELFDVEEIERSHQLVYIHNARVCVYFCKCRGHAEEMFVNVFLALNVALKERRESLPCQVQIGSLLNLAQPPCDGGCLITTRPFPFTSAAGPGCGMTMSGLLLSVLC